MSLARSHHRRLALATSSELTDLTDDDAPLINACIALGIAAEAVVWDASAIDWTSYAGIVIRSCWDYHLRPDAFLEWLDAVHGAGIPIWNPPALVRWNCDKRYLRDLAAHGIPVAPTEWVEPGASASLAAILRDRGWESGAVIKPAIAASAYGTRRIVGEAGHRDQRHLDALLANGAVLVQAFLPEIERDGEWSLMFLSGQYSHAVRKRPAAGDFLVQSAFGGSVTSETPAAPLIADAARALGAVPPMTRVAADDILYARVDGIDRQGRLLLIELECIEPQLFLTTDRGAAGRFAAGIAAALDRVPRRSPARAHRLEIGTRGIPAPQIDSL